MQKHSSNVITDIHNLVTWHHGQNYPFNGCMQFIMEKIGRQDLADYWFFAGISGDSFTFCYGNNGEYNDCLSVVSGGPRFIEDIFNLIGYEHTYVTQDEINADKERFVGKVMEYIDQGTPVLVRVPVGRHSDYNVVCGYEDDGRTLLVLAGDASVPSRVDVTQGVRGDWVFIGSKQKEVNMAELYRNTVLRIPEWLTMPENGTGVSFGAAGLNKWADDIEHGRYDSLTPETFEAWRDYTVYICNLSTNAGGSRNFLARAYRLNRDLAFIPDVIKTYHRAGSDRPGGLWFELERLGGGFNVTLETLEDTKARKAIVAVVSEIGACMERVCRLIEG